MLERLLPVDIAVTCLHFGRQVLERLLPEWQAGGHRVLLFSQTRQMLDILEGLVARLGLTARRMDGTTDIAARQARPSSAPMAARGCECGAARGWRRPWHGERSAARVHRVRRG